MKIQWQVSKKDIELVQSLVKRHRKNPVVKDRFARNLRSDKPPVKKEQFWKSLVHCLLTTQQPSGPKSLVNQFSKTSPFPLRFNLCLEKGKKLRMFTEKLISKKGMRRNKVIATELEDNLCYLEENGGWKETMAAVRNLQTNQTVECERDTAAFIIEHFNGFGPKQSRNLLQALGLTRYEIPLDSRITKWLNNDLGFPMRLSSKELGNLNYYNFVLDGFQKLCKQSGVYPCVLDAAIFVSFDKGEWKDEDMLSFT